MGQFPSDQERVLKLADGQDRVEMPRDVQGGEAAAVTPQHLLLGCNGAEEHWRCGPHDPR